MIPHVIIEDFVKRALLEDLGHGRDVTSEFLIPPAAETTGVLRARSHGILAGLIPALTAFTLMDQDFEIEVYAGDGDVLLPGQEIAKLSGPAQALMSAERTALNILSHLSGIASMTAVYVAEAEGTHAKIAATRKTLPGLRAFQKYAVEVGGGAPHRYGLDDAVLIKDNHIAIAGGIRAALEAAKERAGHMLKIEIEVDTLEQLEEVLYVDISDNVLLDNFSVADLKKAVKMVGGKAVTEASGGVTLETVAKIAKTGVDYISVGALTHSVQALDIGLDIDG